MLCILNRRLLSVYIYIYKVHYVNYLINTASTYYFEKYLENELNPKPPLKGLNLITTIFLIGD